MARKSRLFVSASGIVLACVSLPAGAQTVAGPEDRISSPEAVEVDEGEVVVRGIRRSLQKAADIKKNADEIVDSVVAEDIGKFPDNNAIESIARIPGVQIGRRNDEGFQTLVRGLGGVTTTLNGRESFIINQRAFALQEFAADSLAGVDVFKANTAVNVEAGIAGLINVRLRRPFDLPAGMTVAGNGRAQYYDLTKKTNGIGSLLYNVRQDTGIGEIGMLVNVAYFSAGYNQSVRYAGAPNTPLATQTITPAAPAAFTLPSEDVGLFFGQGFRARPSATIALQWAPDADTMLYAEGFYQGLYGKIRDASFSFRTRTAFNGGPALPISNATYLTPDLESASTPRAQPLILNSGTINYNVPAYTGGGPGPFLNGRNIYLNTVQGAIGGTKSIDRARLSFDVAYTNSVQLDDIKNLDLFINKPFTLNFTYNAAGNQGANFDTPGFDPSLAANYNVRGFVQEFNRFIGNSWQGRFDGVLERDGLFTEFDWGLRFVDRKNRNYGGRRDLNVRALNIPLASLPGYEPYTYSTEFRGPFLRDYPGFAGIDMDIVRKNWEDTYLPYLRSLTTAGDAAQRAAYNNGSVLPTRDPLRNFRAHEQVYTGYAQAKLTAELGFPVDGIIGARLINTVDRIDAVGRQGVGGVLVATPFVGRKNYVDVLPNASVRARFTDKLQLRLSYTESLIRPDFGSLSPALTFNTLNTSATRGNPDLNPTRSDNYDASLEYYPARGSAVTLAVFQKNVDGFVVTLTNPEFPLPGFGTVSLQQPTNAGRGKIKGVEFAANTVFSFLPKPLDGFGVAGNLTYLKGSQQLPVAGSTLAPLSAVIAIPGLSKWTYNLTGFYEKGPFSARVSYNYRSRYVGAVNVTGALPFFPERVTAISRLDASASIQVTKEVAITADAANLLGKPFRNYIDDPAYPRDVRYESKVYSVGARFRF